MKALQSPCAGPGRAFNEHGNAVNHKVQPPNLLPRTFTCHPGSCRAGTQEGLMYQQCAASQIKCIKGQHSLLKQKSSVCVRLILNSILKAFQRLYESKTK